VGTTMGTTMGTTLQTRNTKLAQNFTLISIIQNFGL
jgi:hypothetical protein